jgi:ubiquinone/menaquinone biosynthesis C-methylase UbiE
MKDLVENRRRVRLGSKVSLAWISIRSNGLLWFVFLSIYYLGSAMSEFGFRHADRLRRQKNLPGMNSLQANKLIWERWDWSGKGDEWTISPEWKSSVIRNFIEPYFEDRGTILEVGPGAGRWSEFLISKAKNFIGVDISEACVVECRKRFSVFPNAEFVVGNGCDLAMISSDSVDAIWSFDVFVHINSDEFRSYVGEFQRVLRTGGVVVVHHGSVGGSRGGWRSNMTTALAREFLTESGLEVEKQVQSWIDAGTEYPAGLYSDTITVARKIASA